MVGGVVLLFSFTLLLSNYGHTERRRKRRSSSMAVSLPRLGTRNRVATIALCDSASCFRCGVRPVNCRCRLVGSFTHSRNLGLGVGITRDPTGLVRVLRTKRTSIITCPVRVDGHVGRGLVCYKQRRRSYRILVRHTGGNSGIVASIARLLKGSICMGPKAGCFRQLGGLSIRLKNNVQVRRTSTSAIAARSLVNVISRKRVPCAVDSRGVTHLGGACF